MSSMRIFTDGSSTVYHDKTGNRYGGIGVYVEDHPQLNVSRSYKGEDISNQKMELKACLYAIATFINYQKGHDLKQDLLIITDSMYLINSITEWAPKWEENDWKRRVKGKMKEVSHLDLIKKIYYAVKKYRVKFRHVRSHQVAPSKTNDYEQWRLWYGNQQADRLAREAMERIMK